MYSKFHRDQTYVSLFIIGGTNFGVQSTGRGEVNFLNSWKTPKNTYWKRQIEDA